MMRIYNREYFKKELAVFKYKRWSFGISLLPFELRNVLNEELYINEQVNALDGECFAKDTILGCATATLC